MSNAIRESFKSAIGGKPTTEELDRGLVRDVRMLGPKSRNNRLYPRAVVEEAIKRYEGVVSNVDHRRSASDDVSAQSRFGWFENCRVDSDGGIRGDYKFNTQHSYAKEFRWWVENNPNAIAFSHFADVTRTKKFIANEWLEVAESINEVLSVDVVADGGTTNGIFESQGGNPVTPTPAEIAKSFATADDFKTFMTALMGALTLKPDEQLTVLEDILSAMPDPTATAGESAKIAKLGRYGAIGKWAAATLIAANTVAEAEKKKTAAIAMVDSVIAEVGIDKKFVSETLHASLIGVDKDAAKGILNAVKESLTVAPAPGKKPGEKPKVEFDVKKLAETAWSK